MIRHPVGRSATIRELNERNRAFWKEQSSLFYRRLADPVIAEWIKEELEHYSAWSVPVPHWKSMEKLADDAARIKQRVLAGQGRRAAAQRSRMHCKS